MTVATILLVVMGRLVPGTERVVLASFRAVFDCRYLQELLLAAV